MKKVRIDMRRIETKKEFAEALYKAIGFEGEAGYNLDAISDVLSAWTEKIRIQLLYWNGFEKRAPIIASGVKQVLTDRMEDNRALSVAFRKRGSFGF